MGGLEAFDEGFRKKGFSTIAGVDEAGRGALAGPVVAGAVVLPPCCPLVGVNDSKRICERKREELFSLVVRHALAVGIGMSWPELIDRHNILIATLRAMRRAVGRLGLRPDLVLVDGRDLIETSGASVAITGGDGRSLSIAAASVVAKVARDRLMRKLHFRFPIYGFDRNKGYGSREHVRSIAKYGLSPAHRRSYRVKAIEKEFQLV